MSVVARRRQHMTVYYAVFSWQGTRVWERAGTDHREAVRLEKRRRQEVANGTYQPPHTRRVTTFGAYAKGWLAQRSNRTARDDVQRVYQHVLSRAWLVDMPLRDLRPKHMKQLIEELKATVSKKTGQPLEAKTVANTFGPVRTMMRDARLAELVDADPCELPRGILPRKVGKPRSAYTAAELVALTGPRVPPLLRMFNALALYTGMREGEVCARRWADYDAEAGALSVVSQYNDQPLKTDDEHAEHPRLVPVHRNLREALRWWNAVGFRHVFGRQPLDTDRIVPHPDGSTHTRGTAYYYWRRSCELAGVNNRSLHSTRHTFITLCRRGGARKDVIERVTHNAKGDIVDAYTHFDWQPLVDAVSCLAVDAGVDTSLGVSADVLPPPVSTPGGATAADGNPRASAGDAGVDGTAVPGDSEPPAARCAARQQPPWPWGPARTFRIAAGVVSRVA